VVLDCLFAEVPVTGDPVELVQREEAVAVCRDELNRREDKLELLLG
jgi:hypothetical protein